MSIASSQHQWYIGKVTYYNASRNFVILQLLVESGVDGRRWEGVVDDQIARFPPNGRVHGKMSNLETHVGDLWQFVVDEVHESEDSHHHDLRNAYRMASPIRPVEVIDLRHFKGIDDLKRSLTSDGFAFDPVPIATHLILWLADGTFVGPLVMKRLSNQADMWIVDHSVLHKDLSRMPIHRDIDKHIDHVVISGNRLFLAPEAAGAIAKTSEIQNWATDMEVAKSILTKLIRADRKRVEALKVTKSIFDEHLLHLEDISGVGTNSALERARADRGAAFVRTIEQNIDLLNEAAEMIGNSETVQAESKKWVESERERLLAEKRAEIDSSLAKDRDESIRLRAAVEDRRRELELLNGEVAVRTREAEGRIAEIEREMETRLDEIAQRPAAFFAESAVLRATLASTGGERPAAPPVPPLASRNEPVGPVRLLSDGKKVCSALGDAIGATHLDALTVLHAVLVAGAVPVVIGDRADEMVTTYASVVAHGRLSWIPVGCSLLEPQDLLGRYDVAAGRIIPHPGGVLDVIRDATTSDHLHIVVLDGFNRAPVEGYLTPLIQSATVEAGAHGKAIPIASPNVVSASDPYRWATKVQWPPNVLLICLPARGGTALPIYPDLWRYLAVVDTDGHGSMPTTADDRDEIEPSEVPYTVWTELINQSTVGSTEDGEVRLRRVAEGWKVPGSGIRAALRTYRAARKLRMDENDALGMAIKSVLVARSAATETEMATTLTREGIESVPDWRPVRAEVARLGT